ncbi:hypothetical protein INT47_009008 [Mucor saturninus]|uniref:Uncharacterized protein n=1 Tax=Mucor saturninus TaxID=64648 RepID=A0A8H7QTH2_9FUNG|nr:hypothetical protein INT47_009008 [Mucor saturninus]
MIEIDTLKASNHHYSKLCYDDTDSSEPDTALNTPTGSLTDSFSRRYSSSSSTSSFKYGTQRKPSFTPRSPEFNPQQQHTEVLEKRIQALEHDITEHVKREADLQSQVLMLTEKHKGAPTRQYKSTLTRISKQIDQFLVSHDKAKKSVCWSDEDWTGNEIPTLYGEEVSDIPSTPNMSIPMVLIFRLKSMLDAAQPELCTEIYRSLNSWQEFYHNKLVTDKEIKAHEQSRVSRLLEALQKSLLRNKLLKQDHALLEEKYKHDITNLLNDINCKQVVNKEQQNDGSEKSFSQTKKLLESHIHKLEKQLFECQDERDEYETTLEMVRREMETMLEELEDTRQQRLRYKTQASRLRAGLEAIQKRQSKEDDSRSTDEDEDEEEDEGKEAIRLMYNEAERQAIDLDRECKRQALTLNGIRQELKSTEERYQSIKTEKNRDLKNLQRTNQKLIRDLEIVQLEKLEMAQSVSKAEEDEERFALQVNLKAAKSDAVIQRTKISQLERQSSLADLNNSFVAGLQDLFQKELKAVSGQSDEIMKEMANIIETEQKVWKNESLKTFQKQFDIDLLRVNRELRFLSCKLNDMEEETRVLKARHLEELSLLKYQSNSEFQKKFHQITTHHQLREQELKNQLESLFQKNQTLQDESVILYGRNMLMAHKLGKIDRLPEK